MKNRILFLLAAVVMVALTSCNSRTLQNREKSTDPLVANIDSTVKPGDDFFLFANGKWFKEHPIPASEQSNGLWQLIQDTINSQVRHICESSATLATEPKGSNKQKIGDFFFTGMDSVNLNRQGISALKSDFDKIDGVKNLTDLAVVAAYIHSVAGSPLCSFDVRLAAGSRTLADTRDPLKNYNKYPLAKLKQMTPDFDWSRFFESTGLQKVDTVIVGQPEFLTALNQQLKAFPLEVWKNYLRFHLVRGLARFLDDKTYHEYFSFYSTTLRGIPQPKPRWKRVVEQTDGLLGELIGKIYVDEYLPKGTKEKLTEIGNSIKTVYAERIKSLEWMSEITKVKALKKLDAVIIKVGYPDNWKDMSAMQIDRSSYVGNAISSNKWWFGYMISRFGKPVDRTEWDMEPQTYNAYYNPSNNEIVVPGCNIIVPGFERKLADDAILYSVIGGSTFGHEITHGFDDQGCKYDEKGNLFNWWTLDDSVRFFARTKMIVRQFNNFIAVDTLHIKGDQTQGENIADLGGIVMGYEAFKKTNQYKNREIIAGLDPDKRFFLGYALAWMINDRPEGIANQVRSDVHSPAKFRVLGPLSNMPEFFKTFGIKKGEAMWKPDSLMVKIW